MSEDVFTWSLQSLACGKYNVAQFGEQPAISVHREVAKYLLEMWEVPHYVDRECVREEFKKYRYRGDVVHDLPSQRESFTYLHELQEAVYQLNMCGIAVPFL